MVGLSGYVEGIIMFLKYNNPMLHLHHFIKKES